MHIHKHRANNDNKNILNSFLDCYFFNLVLIFVRYRIIVVMNNYYHCVYNKPINVTVDIITIYTKRMIIRHQCPNTYFLSSAISIVHEIRDFNCKNSR